MSRQPFDDDPLPPDDILVARLRGKDEAAFALLLGAWSGGLRRVAASYVASSASAEEVVQDTWLAVIESIDSFEGRSSLKHWCTGSRRTRPSVEQSERAVRSRRAA